VVKYLEKSRKGKERRDTAGRCGTAGVGLMVETVQNRGFEN